ncbi:MAG: hypothetical protein GY844_03265 [Bradyrhizobium sp.]|nr:hypothetical protein [Bradyrhizobium sp.]
MFAKLAIFRPVQRQCVPLPANGHSNDNLQGLRRPQGLRRIPSPALACHWDLIDGVLTCHWQVECADADPDRPRCPAQKLAA